MSKWKQHKYHARTFVNESRDYIGECDDAADTEQIIREHNAHAGLIALCQEQLDDLEEDWGPEIGTSAHVIHDTDDGVEHLANEEAKKLRDALEAAGETG